MDYRGHSVSDLETCKCVIMTIEENDVNQVSRSLSQKFRSGDKWVAWASFNGSVCRENLMTFRKIADAYKYCDENTGQSGEDDFYYYKFKPIINVLKDLSGASSLSQNRIDISRLEEQIKQYPIEAYNNDKPLVEILSDGHYHPISIQQQVNPVADIDSYVVNGHKYPTGMIYEVGHSTRNFGEFKSLKEAQQLFDELVSKQDISALGTPEYKLIGKIKGQALALDMEDFPQKGTGVLFQIANCLKNEDGVRKYEIQQVNGFDRPVEIELHKMARYNGHNSTLEFFDGELKKVAFNAKVDFMCFFQLSSDAVHINKPLQQSVSGENSSQKEDVKIEGRRFKPGF